MSRDGWLPPGCTDVDVDDAYEAMNPQERHERYLRGERVFFEQEPSLLLNDFDRAYLFGAFEQALEHIAAEVWMAETHGQLASRVGEIVARAMKTKQRVIQRAEGGKT